MRSLALALALVLALPLVHVANADAGCSDGSLVGVAGLYVAPDGSLWQESNGVAGLQQGGCTDDNGRDVGPDTPVF
jgi:hypothetical protein